MNATAQEKQSQNWSLPETAAHNGISQSQIRRGTDRLLADVMNIEYLSPVELAHRLGLEVHVVLKGRHENEYWCPTHNAKINPHISAFGMPPFQKRLLCPRCMKSVPYVTGDELGQIVKGSEE